MKIRYFLTTGAVLTALAGSTFAQEAPAVDDPVVVTINGKDYTAGELDLLRRNLPDVFRRQTQQMSNKTFVETLGYLLTASQRAEESKLLETEPWKTQLWFNQLNFLANAHLATINSSLQITEEDKARFYEEHLKEYSEARVSAIYLDYSPIPELAEKQGTDVVSERQAWEKAEKLLLELRNGSDFAELAKEHSSDSGSAAKGGDLGYFSPDDAALSQSVKDAIFGLEPGQISSPIKDGGRYYIFRVTERRPRPYDDVAVDVLRRLQNQMMQEKLEELRQSVRIEYKDPAWGQ